MDAYNNLKKHPSVLALNPKNLKNMNDHLVSPLRGL